MPQNPIQKPSHFAQGGGWGLVGVQALGVIAIGGWALVSTAAIFAILKATLGIRMSPVDEARGADWTEHNVKGPHSNLRDN